MPGGDDRVFVDARQRRPHGGEVVDRQQPARGAPGHGQQLGRDDVVGHRRRRRDGQAPRGRRPAPGTPRAPLERRRAQARAGVAVPSDGEHRGQGRRQRRARRHARPGGRALARRTHPVGAAARGPAAARARRRRCRPAPAPRHRGSAPARGARPARGGRGGEQPRHHRVDRVARATSASRAACATCDSEAAAAPETHRATPARRRARRCRRAAGPGARLRRPALAARAALRTICAQPLGLGQRRVGLEDGEDLAASAHRVHDALERDGPKARVSPSARRRRYATGPGGTGSRAGSTASTMPHACAWAAASSTSQTPLGSQTKWVTSCGNAVDDLARCGRATRRWA